jgi:hypothetical protein
MPSHSNSLAAHKTHLAAIHIAHLFASIFSFSLFFGCLCSFAFELLVGVPKNLHLWIGFFSQNQCCRAKS